MAIVWIFTWLHLVAIVFFSFFIVIIIIENLKGHVNYLSNQISLTLAYTIHCTLCIIYRAMVGQEEKTET